MTEADSNVPQYPYGRLDGTRGKTTLTPEEQLEVSRRVLEGESLLAVANRLHTTHSVISRFVRATGIFEKQDELMNELLATQYLELRQNQFAVAQDYINKARALGAELFALALTTMQEWRDTPPKDMTPSSLAKLLHQFRKLQEDWVRLAGVPAGVTEHRMLITKDEEPPRKNITIDSLIERGVKPDQIHELITIAEQFQTTRALTSGDPDIERDTTPESHSDEGGSGVDALQEGL